MSEMSYPTRFVIEPKFLWSIESPAGDGPLYVWIWRHTVMGVGGMAFSTALFAVLWCALWWPLAEWMYRRGIVVKL